MNIGEHIDVWRRADDVLWRIGPDRVLVRRVGGDGLDLIGTTALVWVALELPRAISELHVELADVVASAGEIDRALAAMAAQFLVVGGRL